MSETHKSKPEHGENPTEEELEVESPNESAPGHEPDPDEHEAGTDAS